MSICDRLRTGVLSTSAEETQALARELAQVLPPDAVLALHGDLGVGKTTFVQGLARAFGIEGAVTSPTFTIYTIHQGSRRLVHLDAYRLSSAAQMDALLVDDFLQSPYCLAIEWPERIESWIPAEAWHLDLGIESSGHRLRLR
jgi:tRNA threonylcarbamoyladenosine biosynthesis protein TsaE